MITVAVVGGGAAGMMAALEAASRGAAVSVFERQNRVGRKLAVTGNGRCNLTNINATTLSYHGAEAGFAAPALRRFSVTETLAHFRGLGLLTVTEPDGRVYPLSDTAGSVVDVLRFAMDASGVRLKDSCEVIALERSGSGWRVVCPDGPFPADRVIIACGGMARRPRRTAFTFRQAIPLRVSPKVEWQFKRSHNAKERFFCEHRRAVFCAFRALSN